MGEHDSVPDTGELDNSDQVSGLLNTLFQPLPEVDPDSTTGSQAALGKDKYTQMMLERRDAISQLGTLLTNEDQGEAVALQLIAAYENNAPTEPGNPVERATLNHWQQVFIGLGLGEAAAASPELVPESFWDFLENTVVERDTNDPARQSTNDFRTWSQIVLTRENWREAPSWPSDETDSKNPDKADDPLRGIEHNTLSRILAFYELADNQVQRLAQVATATNFVPLDTRSGILIGLQKDLVELARAKSSLQSLLDLVEKNTVTNELVRAYAYHVHDDALMSTRRNEYNRDPSVLHQDIANGRYRSPEGQQAAKLLYGALTFEATAGSVGTLTNAITSGDFYDENQRLLAEEQCAEMLAQYGIGANAELIRRWLVEDESRMKDFPDLLGVHDRLLNALYENQPYRLLAAYDENDEFYTRFGSLQARERLVTLGFLKGGHEADE